jgi:hypothetical protein
MSLLLDEIKISGIEEPGRVHIEFSNILLNLDVNMARKVAAAILGQADITELEGMRAAGREAYPKAYKT